uniref:Carboxylesterase type B domain-containing protein n=1 Tax=Panagrolaimus sp. PS1159 TaxID=55785 RepID=A0AC35FSJ6_9BILA
MSGSALAPWAQGDFVLKTSSMLAEEIGCSNSSNVKECLKGKTVEEIKKAAAKVSKNVVKTEGVNIADFHPRVDGEFLHGLTVEEAFKRAPKIEHFMGICSQENIPTENHEVFRSYLKISVVNIPFEEGVAQFGVEDLYRDE